MDDKGTYFMRPRASSTSAVNRKKESKVVKESKVKSKKMSDSKFKALVRECVRIHDRAVAAVEAKEYDMLEVLKCKLMDIDKSMELEYFALSATNLHEACHEDYVENKDKNMLLVAKINAAISENAKSVQSELANTPISPVGVRLPKFELSGFSGSPNEWLNFRDIFESSIIHNTKLTNVERFQYLISSLKGAALQLVKGFPISDSNFENAWQTLKERYDNKYKIASAQIEKIFAIKPTKVGSAKSLHDLLDACNEAVRNLTSLGYYESNKFSNLMIVNILLGKLDDNLRHLFMLSLSKTEDPTYEKLIEFIAKHAHSLSIVKDSNSKPELNKPFPKRTVVSNVVVPNQVQSCTLCQQNHLLGKCDKFLKLSLEKRWEFVKHNNLCFNCLRANHRVQNCLFQSRCRHCQSKHHSNLHNTPPTKPKPSNQSNPNDNHVSKTFHNKTKSKTEVTGQPDGSTQEPNATETNLKCFSSTNDSNTSSNILLSTAMIKIKSRSGKVKLCRALIDNGSQRSLISKQCCQELGLVLKKSSHTICGINDLVAETSFSEVTCHFSAHFNSQWMNLHALVVSKVTADLPNFVISSENWPHLNHFILADPEFAKTRLVEILLGADLYSDLITSCPIPSVDGSPAAIDSKLGFILCGKVSAKFSEFQPIVNCHAHIEVNQELQRFWELESLPKTKLLSNDDRLCKEIYASSVKRDISGRYTVDLPFRPNFKLGDTRAAALRRFLLLEKRLTNNLNLKLEYCDFMTQYENLFHMCKIPESSLNHDGCYLPHHAVVKEHSSTTRVRVVFDASMRSTLQTSLNDCFLTGPKLQADLFQTLVRFRSFPIALSSDVEKMYRQIRVNPEHCNYQKIFWRHSPQAPLDEFRLSTVTYGMSCAPYLAIRTLQQLAKDEKINFPAASEVVLNHFYVDDLLSGANSASEAQNLVQDLISLMQSGGFLLRKWVSNCPQAIENVPEEHKSSSSCVPIDENNSLKILGIKWDSVQDTIQIDSRPPNVINSKRQLLSVIARTFDPLGLLSPSTVVLKILLQDLWRDNLSWDDPLPPSIIQTWSRFSAENQYFSKIKIDRCLQSTSEAAIDYQLHGFADASARAYAAVVYLRTVLVSGGIKVNIIAAKTRVAPTKSITLPRLELCGTVLLAELCSNILTVLPFPISSIHLYSDSQIVLSWLRTEPASLSTFVSHRVAQIQNSTSSALWSHVRSQENPADVASRGILPHDLSIHSLWWTGPPWLSDVSHPSNDPPASAELSDCDQEAFRKELRSKTTVVFSVQTIEPLEIFSKCSSFSKLIRIIAFCARFIHNSSHGSEKLSGHLSSLELLKAIHLIVRSLQLHHFHSELKLLSEGSPLLPSSPYNSLSLFLDSEGIIRVGGRLTFSQLKYDTKHPMLLPKSHPVIIIIIDYFHKHSLHAGTSVVLSLLRQQFWILAGRSKVRQVLRKCIVCAKLNARTSTQLMGDLPRERVTPSRPFAKVGVDFAGPVLTKPNLPRSKTKIKSYIALFVCFATKSVHLEIVSELSTEAFLACLKRFVSRRGLPSDIFSDNGSNFKGADNHLKSVLSVLNSDPVQNFATNHFIHWHFSPPGAPHFGGLWESNIKSAKRHLSKVCNSAILTFEELSTLMTQVEACLNSRPISPFSDDPNDLEPLTPGHFLIGAPLCSLPETVPNHAMTLRSRWALVQSLQNNFWSRWTRDYLNTLQAKPKWTSVATNIKVGELVLMRADISAHPLKWTMARVTDVFPGADGIVRVVNVKTASGIMKRPITKLCPLPIE